MELKSGTGPTRDSHLDRDLHLSFGNIAPLSFPAEFLTDSTNDFPDQNADGQPFGCTNYTQAALATNLVNGIVTFKPADLEAVTHANQKGGLDIRLSLSAAKDLGWIQGYYLITQIPGLDMFDTFRTAQTACLPERRSISWGTPWFPSWEKAALAGTYIMPMPTDAELEVARKDPRALPWHNSEDAGWTDENGVPVYRNKCWQGTHVGRNGYIGFTREVINTVMALWGTVAFTGTNQIPDNIVTVQLNTLQYLFSVLRNLLTQLTTPKPMPTKSMLDTFCTALMNFEGKPGDLNYLNNNPGNVRCSPVGYLAKYGNVKCVNRFAKFPTFELGWEYLLATVHHRAVLHPDWTILDFFQQWAPPSDNNPTHIYAQTVADKCGVPVTTTLKELLG